MVDFSYWPTGYRLISRVIMQYIDLLFFSLVHLFPSSLELAIKASSTSDAYNQPVEAIPSSECIDMPESDEELVVSTDAVTSEPSTSADIRGSPHEEIDVENVIVVKEKKY